MKTNTYNIIRGALSDLPFSTASEIAEQADYSVATVRSYLAEMVKRGEVVSRDILRESERRYGRTRLVHINVYRLADA